MAGPNLNTSGGVDAWVRRARRNIRTPAAAMAAFLVGILVAALFIPSHSGSGSSADGTAGARGSGGAAGSSLAGGSGTANGTASATGSGTGPGGSASALGATSAGGSGASGSLGKESAAALAAAGSVTASSIKLAVLAGSSQTAGAACPRCSNGGEATDEATVNGLIALWHKQGKIPVYGRNIDPVFAQANEFDQTGVTVESACEQLGDQHPFVALTGLAIGGDSCLGKYDTFTFDGTGGVQIPTLRADAPYVWEVGPTLEESLIGWASWANEEGLLKGHTLGLYAPNDQADSGFQELLNATFIPELAKLGYHLTVDYAYSGEGQSDDPVAVQEMRAKGVNVVFVAGPSLTEPAGFQNEAQQLNYDPTYPTVDVGNAPFDDSLADVTYNANAENGDLGLGSRWWDWTARSPASTSNNPAAQQCAQAYEDATGTTLDVYNDDAELRYILDECSDMQVILQALENAGSNLTGQSFLHGLEQVQNLQTAEYESVSFTGGPGAGGDNDWQSAQFNKNRWQPSNDYWEMIGPYGNWADFPGDAATLAEAVKEGQ